MFKKIVITSIFIFFPFITQAEGLTLSISPPLIKNNVNPGQIWKSAIKVVNNNASDIEIYAQVLDFKSGDNGNTVEFLPALSEKEKEDKIRLSSWIVVEKEKIIIPAFKSVDVSFVIDVPKDAEPGGHYGAILIGTTPPKEKLSGSVVKISSMLSSLILLSVDGDVKEDGRIREFSTDKEYYFQSKVDFKVKFENLGNVHIQPRGEIRIYDFFGKTKEVITLNHKSEFGNVLPANSRIWNFSWQGSGDLREMGRYKAQLVLSYGNKERSTIDQNLFFWIIYPKPLLIVGGTLLFLFLLIFFLIKSYIKSSIRNAQLANGLIVDNEVAKKMQSRVVETKSAVLMDKSTLNKIVGDKNKVINLKNSSPVTVKENDEIMKNVRWSGFKKFMITILVSLFVVASVFIYLHFFGKTGQTVDYNKLFQDNKASEQAKLTEKSPVATSSDAMNDKTEIVKIDETTASNTATEMATSSVENNASSSEELTSDNDELTSEASSSDELSVIEEIIPKANGELLIKVLNGGGTVGTASEVVELIGQKKYKPAQVGNADNYDYETTLISYKKGDLSYAEEIKSLIDRKAIIEESAEQEEDIVVIIGKSFVSTK